MRLDDLNRPEPVFNSPEYWREIAEGLWRAADHFKLKAPSSAFAMRCTAKTCIEYSLRPQKHEQNN